MSRFTFKSIDSKKSSVTKYTAHKSWTVTQDTDDDFGIKTFTSSYASSSFNIGDPLDTNLSTFDILTPDGIYERNIFNSINHIYYSDDYNINSAGDNEFFPLQTRELLSYVYAWSIPSKIFGDRILPGTVKIDADAISYLDDGYGNLIDSSALNTTNRSLFQEEIKDRYILPNDSYVYLTLDSERANYSNILPTHNLLSRGSNKNISVLGKNIEFDLGRKTGSKTYNNKTVLYRAVNLTGTASLNSGSESILEINNSIGKSWNDDFAISCWLKLPTSQSVSSSFSGPFGNLANRTLEAHTENIIATSRGYIESQEDNNVIPWEISIVNDTNGNTEHGKIYARRGMYDNVTLLSSSVSFNTNNAEDSDNEIFTHVIFQKTGSNLQLFVGSGSHAKIANPDNRKWIANSITSSIATATDPLADTDVRSTANICIGARREGFRQRTLTRGSNKFNTKFNPCYVNTLSASIDEFIIYDQAMNNQQTTATAHANQVRQSHLFGSSPYYGNVFYNHGIIVVTNAVNNETVNRLTEIYTLSFSGSQDITAHSYKCTIEDGEYNMTLNPSARQGYNINNPKPQGFVTGSFFTPYITTIGLYNDNNELLGIGKLAQPIKSPKDFDITFEVKFDT